MRRAADFFKAEEWPEQHEWLQANLETFHKVFAPRVMRLETLDQESAVVHELEDNWAVLRQNSFTCSFNNLGNGM